MSGVAVGETAALTQESALELVKSFISGRGLEPPRAYFVYHRPEDGQWAVTTHIYLRLLVDERTGKITLRCSEEG